MIEKRTWQEFRDSKLLWWANRLLQTFGWSLIAVVEKSKVVDVYPARVKFRGYSEDIDNSGFVGIVDYVVKNSDELKNDIQDDNLVSGIDDEK